MKTCKADNCISPVFSHLYCGRHQYLRTDKKPKKIAPHSQKERIATIDFGFTDQISMFQALWEQAKDEKGIVTCPYTQERLNRFYNTEFWYSCFAHVLPKGKYTYWKLNPLNLRIVFHLFHSCVDQGTLEARKDHPDWKFSVWDKEVEELKLQYSNFKKLNLLS